MKIKIVMILLALLCGLLAVIPAAGQPGNIILGGADESNTFIMTSSQNLNTLISNVGTRFVIEFANTKNVFNLSSPPSGLLTLIEQVSDRFVIQYANGKYVFYFDYPKSIINDLIPPKISNVSAQGMGYITWTTDEFATSTVIYNPTIVTDTGEITNPLFTKQHQVMLTGLTPGQEYTYQVSSTDRSGNTSTSGEHKFIAKESLTTFLPIIVGSR